MSCIFNFLFGLQPPGGDKGDKGDPGTKVGYLSGKFGMPKYIDLIRNPPNSLIFFSPLDRERQVDQGYQERRAVSVARWVQT